MGAIVCNLTHVHMASSYFVFPQTVSGVEGDVTTQTPFNLAPGSTSTSSKRGTKVRARSSSDCNETTLKKGGKKHGHLRSECSGIYTKEKVSVHHSATEHTLSPPSDTFHPSIQVNHCFMWAIFLFPPWI